MFQFSLNAQLPPPTGLNPGSTIPPGPTLSSPTVNFSWNSVAGANKYSFHLRDLANTNILIVDRTNSANSANQSLIRNHSYKWDVRAYSSNGVPGNITADHYIQIAPCTYNVSQVPSTPVSACSGFIFPSVSTESDCSCCVWTATGGAAWMRVSGGGTGPGNVTLSLDANASNTNRSATFTVTGTNCSQNCSQTFTITQRANSPPTAPTSITIGTVSPNSVNFSWTQPSDPDGCPGSFDHETELWLGGSRVGNNRTFGLSSAFSGLTANTTYVLRVRGIEKPDIFGPEVAGGWATNSFTTPQLPTVVITQPFEGQRFTEPATISIAATASAPYGSISKVEFFSGVTNKVGEDTSTPFSVNWTDVGIGTYSLTARATDNVGASGTSPAITVYVDPPGGLLQVTIPPVPALTNGSLDALDAVFSKAINASTFDYTDLNLSRNGSPIALDAGVTTTQISGNAYRVLGLGTFTAARGGYVLTVNASGILDDLGYPGSGSASAVWSNAPLAVTEVATPTLTNTPVATIDVTFSGGIDPSTFTYHDLTLTRNGAALMLDASITTSLVSGDTYRIAGLGALTAAEGTYVISVNASNIVDTFGNSGSGSRSGTWTNRLLTVTSIIVPRNTNGPASSVDVVFSAAIDPTSFTYQDVSLRRDGTNVPLDDLVWCSPISGSTNRINGLAPFTTQPGNYVITVTATGIRDVLGASGTGSKSNGWWNFPYQITITVLRATEFDSEALGVAGAQQVGYANQSSGSPRACLWSGSSNSLVYLHPVSAANSMALATSGSQQAGYATFGTRKNAAIWAGTSNSFANLYPSSTVDSWVNATTGSKQVGRADNRAALWFGTSSSRVQSIHASEAFAVADGNDNEFGKSWNIDEQKWWAAKWQGNMFFTIPFTRDAQINAVSQSKLAGFVGPFGFTHAALWSGASSSFVDLNPSGASSSSANAISGSMQAGFAVFPGITSHAALWSGSSNSFLDLHYFLPSTYSGSRANGMSTNGQTVFVVGSADSVSSKHAIMWTINPAVFGAPGAFTLTNEVPQCISGSPQVRLTWSAPSGIVESFVVFRDGNPIRTNAISPHSFDDTIGLVAGSHYTYFVRAYSQYGYRDSDTNIVSIPFGVCCNYTLSPTSRVHGSGFEQQDITVSRTAGSCDWTATNDVPWITFTSPTSGTNSSIISYNVQPNPNCEQRTGTITIAGLEFMVTQAAGVSSYSLAQSNAVHSPVAGAGSVQVNTGIGCSWTATKNVPWLLFASATNGSGTSNILYSIQANPDCQERVGHIMVEGSALASLTFTVTQQAGLGSYLLSSYDASLGPDATNGSVSILVGVACPWSVTNDVGWISFSPTNGTGTNTITYNVAANPDCVGRTGHIAIASEIFTIRQAPGTGAFSLSQPSAVFGPSGASTNVSVTAGIECSWSVANPHGWLTANPLAGNGSGTVNYTVAVNSNGAVRIGTLSIADQSLMVTQFGNDDFAYRFPLSGAPLQFVGNNHGASAESLEPAHAGFAPAKSVWWTWTAPSNCVVTVSTYGSSFDTVLAVYTNNSLASLNVVVSDDDGGGNLTSLVSFNVMAGVGYQIAVDGYAGDTGNIMLSLVLQPPGTPLEILTPSPLPAVVAGDDYSMALQVIGGLSPYTWAMISGSLPDGVSMNISGVISGTPTTAGNFAFRVRVTASGGQSVEKDFTLTVATPVNAPLNDNFANAIPLTGSTVNAVGSNAHATKESGEPRHAFRRGGRSVWWKWTPPLTGVATISTRGSPFDTLLGIYTGASVYALAGVASQDDISPYDLDSETRFFAVAGTNYYIAVDGLNGESGSINLSVEVSASLSTCDVRIDLEKDLVVDANAQLTVELCQSANRTDVPLLKVGGVFRAGGKLNFTLGPRYTPQPGDRFRLVEFPSESDSVDKVYQLYRFNDYDPAIPGTNGLFWGLAYREQDSRHFIELLVLRVPAVWTGATADPLTPRGRGGLVFISHGTAASIEHALDGGFGEMAASIEAVMTKYGNPSWDVTTLDWREYATGSTNSPDFRLFQPATSAQFSLGIAESTAHWLRSNNFQYVKMHLLSHSSGSWMANRLMQLFAGEADIHVTFFDAFVNPSVYGFCSSILFCGRFDSTLGDGARQDFVEQYVDRFFVVLPGTNKRLTNAVNFDVTHATISSPPFGSGSEFLSNGHSWPYQWYLESVRAAYRGELLFSDPKCSGFALSPEFLETTALSPTQMDALRAAREMLHNNDEYVLVGTNSCSLRLPSFFGQIPDFFASVQVGTNGTYQQTTNDGLVIQLPANTPAPTSATVALPINECASGLRFELQFLPGGPPATNGILTVLVDGLVVYRAYQSLLESELVASDVIAFDAPLQPGMHEITFGLESSSSDSVGILIQSVEIGSCIRPFFLTPMILGNGDVHLTLTAVTPAQNYTIQSSTNLVNWSTVTNVQSHSSQVQFTIPSATISKQVFFRAVVP